MNRCARTAAWLAAAVLATTAATANANDLDQSFQLRPEMTEVVNRTLNIGRSAVAKLDVPAQAGQPFSLSIPYEDSHLNLNLTLHSVRSPDYKVFHQLEDGSFIEVEPGPVTTYRGDVEQIPGAVVAGSITEFGFEGKVFMPEGLDNYIIEPLERLMDIAGPGDHVIYPSNERSSDVIGACATADIVNADAIDGPGQPNAQRGTLDLRVADLACDTDFEYFILLGSNTESRINTLVNTINVEYERDVFITHRISGLIIRTTAADPYSSTDSLGLVNQVLSVWNPSNMQEITRDVVHLFTGKEIDGSVIGRAATIGGVCTSFNVCFSQAEYNGVFDCATALVAHELGHLWNAFHCDCVNFTMNPFNTCENQFSDTSIGTISSHRDTRACLESLEPEFAAFPFSDPFPGTSVNPAFWSGSEGTPEVNEDALNEPSGSTSLNISGTDELRSARLDASLQADVVLSFFAERTGGVDSPESGDDLVVEYLNNTFDWIEIERLEGSGPDETNFNFFSLLLDPDAMHGDLRVRFRNTSNNDDFDDYFVDDVELAGTPIFPQDFNLSLPADGAANVASSPLFIWESSAFATEYTLQVDNDINFGSPNLNFTTPLTNFSNPGFQLADGEYFWRVTANNVNGTTSSIQNPSMFTVGAVKEICLGDCTNNGVVDFDDLVRMLFQFGTNPGDGCDANDDNTVDFNDLVTTLFLFGPCD